VEEAWVEGQPAQHAQLDGDPYAAPVMPWSSLADESASVRIDIGLVAEPTPEHPFAPCIQVLVGTPLPPMPVIAAVYDLVLAERGWGQALRGATGWTHKATAIRTWGIAILVRSGVRYVEAMPAVCAAGEFMEVAAQKFNRDRTFLRSRVPKAEDCVMQRRERPQPLSTG
jgi:hypothetical protein